MTMLELTDLVSIFITLLLVINAGLLITNVAVRLYHYGKQGTGSPQPKDLTTSASSPIERCMLIIIGSGGHTQEMLKLVSGLGGQSYPNRVYVLATTDAMGEEKVRRFEAENFGGSGKYEVERIPRSREVGQSYVTSVWTTLVASAASLKLLWRRRPAILLCNGPGTGLPLCLFAAFISSLSSCSILPTSAPTDRSCKVVFIESVCRVKSLSLSALVLYYYAEIGAAWRRWTRYFSTTPSGQATVELLVQWPELQKLYPRTRYIGRLS